MRLVNTNPMGESEVDGVIRGPGEEFEQPDEAGLALLEQRGNFTLAGGQKLDAFTVEQLHHMAERRGTPLDLDGSAKKPDVVKAATDAVTAAPTTAQPTETDGA